MGKIETLVDSILDLPQMVPKDLEPIVGCGVPLSEHGPYWEYYRGIGNGLVSEVDLRVSHPPGRWLLSLTTDLALAPEEGAMDLKRYGARISMDVNPDVFPEGICSYRFSYKGLPITFQFTHTTHRLYAIVMRKD